MRIYTHEACLDHTVPPGHPERPDRLRYLLDYFESSGIARELPIFAATAAARIDIARAHPANHLDLLTALTPRQGVIPVDPDTWLSPGSVSAARYAAGAICDALDAVLLGQDNRAFCAVRPPGHHAEESSAMGFCLLNGIAIAARRALDHHGINRVAILDFDVHHGNGTVDICKDDPRVLVCSSFQHPFYPYRYHDIARPNIVNTPLVAGTSSAEFRRAVETGWWPALQVHQPEIIFVSAGFDAHRLDPLANLELDEADFTWVTRQICRAADLYAGGRVISTLEGGYDLGALARSVHAHIEALSSTW